MSTICGVLKLRGDAPAAEWLPRMLAAALAPQPDDRGRFRNGPIDLGHLALHITPESVHETQPITSAQSNLVLLADVRLDNRSELVLKLGSRGNSEDPPSDTSLLLAAYEKWGERCVEHLLGDFAFAVWDRDKKQLFLARDALGARGLFYYTDGDHFVFASQMPSILELPFVEARINENKVIDELINAPDDGSTTFFRDIYACPAGHTMLASNRGIQRVRYWRLDPEPEIRYARDEEYTEHFLALIAQAVACRLRSIGAVGISLSGGCDSTLLAAVAANLLPASGLRQRRLKSFSYVFDELTDCDERRYIQPVIDRWNLDATLILADDLWTFRDLSEQPLPRDAFCWDCFAQLPLAVARAAAASGCRVLIDGHFGDILFSAGRFLVADWLHAGKWGEAARQLFRHARAVDWCHDVVNHGLRPQVPASWTRVYRRLRPRDLTAAHPGIMRERLELAAARLTAAAQPVTAGLSPSKRHRLRALTDPSWARTSSTLETCARLPIARCSPYFDRRIVEFIMAIPCEQLARIGTDRWLQRNAMARLLPPEVALRKSKTSYEPLLARGLDKERPTVEALLDDPLIVRDRWVQGTWIEQLRARIDRPDDRYPLSTALHLELWLRAVRDAQHNGDWSTAYRYRSRAS